MSTPWAPLHLHSWYSLLDGMGDPAKIAKRAASLGYGACALTDHGNVGGMVDHWKACRKQGIKPIAGCEFYTCREDPTVRDRSNGRPYSHLVVVARNRRGWGKIMRAVSRSNEKDHAYYHPRLHVESFRDFDPAGDLVAISGHPGSDLCNVLFKDPKAAYGCRDYDVLLAEHLDPKAEELWMAKAEQLVSVFGKDSVKVEIQVIDPDGLPASVLAAKANRKLARKAGLEAVATADSHYVERKDAWDQQVLLCAKLKTTLAAVRRRVEQDEDVELGAFFRGDHFHVPSAEEMRAYHRASEMEAAAALAASFDDYEITGPPMLPEFACPGGLSPDAHLRALCEAGFARTGLDPDDGTYRDRLEMELGVIREAGLATYFLVVEDIVHFGRDRGRLMGPGRGSAAGCLVSYLCGITQIDPIPYGLIFERFYNAGRNAPGRISMPDIDVDVPLGLDDEIFAYLGEKYGRDRVAKISTFQTMQGRSALDAVLSARGVEFDDRKQITEIIPDKARIAEELQAMAERGEEPSIIRFALDVYADELADYARLEDDGTLSGDFASHFEQAIRLEGTKKAISTHPAGVIISPVPIAEVCPTRWDEHVGGRVAAVDMVAAEAMGTLKLDILKVAMLNKGEGVRELASTGEIGADAGLD